MSMIHVLIELERLLSFLISRPLQVFTLLVFRPRLNIIYSNNKSAEVMTIVNLVVFTWRSCDRLFHSFRLFITDTSDLVRNSDLVSNINLNNYL